MDNEIALSIRQSGKVILGNSGDIGIAFRFCDFTPERQKDSEIRADGLTIKDLTNKDTFNSASLARTDHIEEQIKSIFESTEFRISSLTWHDGDIEFFISARDERFQNPHERKLAIEEVESVLGTEFPKDASGEYITHEYDSRDRVPPNCGMLLSDAGSKPYPA